MRARPLRAGGGALARRAGPELAIVGLGPWGLAVLERAAHRARASRVPMRVHVVHAGPPGGGAYRVDQPDYLILNNPCGQLSLWAAPPRPGEPEPRYAVGLYEWVVAAGYRWHGHHCRVGPGGRPIAPTDYLPRRLMGEYLGWFYRTLVTDAPPELEVVRHDATAVDVVAGPSGRERVCLDDGRSVTVDHVVLTTGHTFNEEVGSDAIRRWRPYPVDHFDEVAPPGAPLAIEGMGLVAFDLLVGLTLGRGGRFDARGDRFTYRPSGAEPAITLFSRSGVPYCAKAAHGVDPTGSYQPLVATPDAIARLRRCSEGGVDFRADVLPLLYAEMRFRYHFQRTLTSAGPAAAAELRERLGAAWRAGSFDRELGRLERSTGTFDPAAHLFAGREARFESSADYAEWFRAMLADDVTEALDERGSPVKAAQEVTRVLRDDLRSVIEYQGLSHASYLDFQASIRGRLNRLEAGPPPLRLQQLLALLDAGVVRVPHGPGPELRPAAGGVELSSTAFREPHRETAGVLVRGHLDMPSLARTASPLLRRLYDTGRLTELTYGGSPVGSVAIDRGFHPRGACGEIQRSLFVLGVITEGVRYFTHYLPSPRSRLRAVLDAEACIDAIVG